MSNTSDLGSAARAHANDLGAQAKAAATQHATAQVDSAKDTAADKMQAAADAADAAAAQFDPESPQAQAVQQIAEHIEGVASHIRSADLRDLAQQVTQTARQHPLLFIGGAAIAGFAAARFLKARDPRPDPLVTDDPWGTPAAGSTHEPSDDTVMADLNGGRSHA